MLGHYRNEANFVFPSQGNQSQNVVHIWCVISAMAKSFLDQVLNMENLISCQTSNSMSIVKHVCSFSRINIIWLVFE
jgi:hypothetical protein